MSINLFKKDLDGEVELEVNFKEPFNQEQKMLMELWKFGSKEDQKKLAHALLKMARDKNI